MNSGAGEDTALKDSSFTPSAVLASGLCQPPLRTCRWQRSLPAILWTDWLDDWRGIQRSRSEGKHRNPREGKHRNPRVMWRESTHSTSVRYISVVSNESKYIVVEQEIMKIACLLLRTGFVSVDYSDKRLLCISLFPLLNRSSLRVFIRTLF